jgi:PAS domain S-box-containing protein
MPSGHSDKTHSPEPDRFAFSSFIDALPDAIVVVDRAGHIADLNIQAIGLFGYDRHELLGQPVETLLPERLRDQHVVQRGHYDRSPHVRPMGAGASLVARHKDGNELPVEINLGPYQAADGPMVVCTVRSLDGAA